MKIKRYLYNNAARAVHDYEEKTQIRKKYLKLFSIRIFYAFVRQWYSF